MLLSVELIIQNGVCFVFCHSTGCMAHSESPNMESTQPADVISLQLPFHYNELKLLRPFKVKFTAACSTCVKINIALGAFFRQ